MVVLSAGVLVSTTAAAGVVEAAAGAAEVDTAGTYAELAGAGATGVLDSSERGHIYVVVYTISEEV